MISNEIWKPIDKFKDLYEISSIGRVRSNSRKARILKPGSNKQGYRQVSLGKDWKFNTFRINRLVAIAFIPNPDNKPQVNHINGIKWDDRVENLEWVTAKENSIHAFKIGLKTINDLCMKKKIEAVKKLLNKSLINIVTNEEYESLKEASFKTSIPYGTISYWLRNRKYNKTNLRYKSDKIRDIDKNKIKYL
jgi:hypothetical protein